MKIGTSRSFTQIDHGRKRRYPIGRIHRLSRNSYRFDTERNGNLRDPVHGKATTFDSARVSLHRAYNRPLQF